MGNLLGALVLFSTVLFSLGLGITLAYGLILSILHAFAARHKAEAPAARKVAVPVLVASQNHASGD